MIGIEKLEERERWTCSSQLAWRLETRYHSMMLYYSSLGNVEKKVIEVAVCETKKRKSFSRIALAYLNQNLSRSKRSVDLL
jgi:hypothetical protein